MKEKRRPAAAQKPKSKNQLVLLLNNHGASPVNVARLLKVSKVTIHKWINEFEIKVTLPKYY